jgi:hypothetical protein
MNSKISQTKLFIQVTIQETYVGEVMSCLCVVVPNTYCVVFLLFFFVLCTLCCQFLWIVHFWLPLQYSLTFIWDIIYLNEGLLQIIVKWNLFKNISEANADNLITFYTWFDINELCWELEILSWSPDII